MRVAQRRVCGPAVAPPLTLEKFMLDYKRYSQKFLRQLLRNMQQFILEKILDIIVSESGGEIDEIVHLERDKFIGIMLRMHQANSSKNCD